MLSKFFGCSAVAAAALLVGTLPVLAHDGHDNMCGGVAEADDDMVVTSSGKALLLSSSAPCPEAQQAAAVESSTAAAEPAAGTTETAAASGLGELPHGGLVYFALDSAELDESDQAMLNDIIAAVKESGPAKIVVRGHADRAGDEAYNESLSAKRAETVAAALLAAGIPADSVRTMGMGETAPAVETEDGVAMRQNRRAAVQSDE